MKLAICFYGQPRYYSSWMKHMKKMYLGCDVSYYAHFWGNEEEEENIKKVFEFEDILVQSQIQKFKDFPCEPDLTKITKDVFTTLSPLYSLQQLHNLIKNSKKDYDFWILTRTDIGVESDVSLLDIELDKEKIYSSYVRGYDWMRTHIDTKFIMCNKKNILNLTNIYSDLEHYVCDKKISLCHHRLFFNSLLKYKNKMEMICLDSNDDYTCGWRWVRNNQLSIE